LTHRQDHEKRKPTEASLIGYASERDAVQNEKLKPSRKNLNSVNFATQTPFSRKKLIPVPFGDP